VSRYLTDLAVGQRCRLTEGGPIYTVTRVTPCACYVRGGLPRQVTVTDRRTGEVRSFVAGGSEVLAIARNAFVLPAEEGL
jgi:hypothetical protein